LDEDNEKEIRINKFLDHLQINPLGFYFDLKENYYEKNKIVP